ncbi:MAG: hypothetical protein K9H49_11175 [Bacteroidales bacterium]|nr:hypothetical protein [Bacteroidales bacterium]MCF8392063.1 hypothetical protein [Bacteroidales bacterium]
MKKLAIISLAILTMCFTCEERETQIEEQVEYLSYGTSYGECIGYCVKEVRVGGNIVYTKSGWDVEGELPDSTCILTFIMDPLPAYVERVNLADFKKLDDVIGCPDCADGGAEWLELSIDGEVKRVTFEYMNEPNQLKLIIEDLRKLMQGFEGCGG